MAFGNTLPTCKRWHWGELYGWIWSPSISSTFLVSCPVFVYFIWFDPQWKLSNHRIIESVVVPIWLKFVLGKMLCPVFLINDFNSLIKRIWTSRGSEQHLDNCMVTQKEKSFHGIVAFTKAVPQNILSWKINLRNLFLSAHTHKIYSWLTYELLMIWTGRHQVHKQSLVTEVKGSMKTSDRLITTSHILQRRTRIPLWTILCSCPHPTKHI